MTLLPCWVLVADGYFEHRLPCDATQIGRFRRDLGEAPPWSHQVKPSRHYVNA